MASAIALMVELLPAFAKNVTHVNERQVGVIFAIDSVGIVLFQLPIARLLQGRRRMRGLAVMGVVWSVALLLVWAAGEWTTATAAAVVLCGASAVFAIGECLHGAIHAPLGVDLAPPRLLGRYLALASLSWQVGWIVGPAGGGFLLQHAPLVLWPVAAAVNLACASGALALERRLPENVRLTPLAAGSSG
jgi:MFS family permease